MRTLITGATGLLGTHLVVEGIKLGHDITILTREIPVRSHIQNLKNDVKIIEGNFTDIEVLKKLPAFDSVIHAAAQVSYLQKDFTHMQAVNVQGTKDLYDLCRTKSFTYVSSVATRSDGSIQMSNEDTIHPRDTTYAQTKWQAEKYLDQRDKPKSLIVHPCYMLGAYDSKPSSGAILIALRMKRFSHYLSCTKNFVHAKDVAHGIYQALAAQCTGHYMLGGHNIGIKEFLNACTKELNMEMTSEEISDQLLLQLPTEQQIAIKEFCSSNAVDSSKAKRDFSYQATYSLEQMIKEEVDWLEERKMLRRK
jgi:dihydroflavonol-4-reductase